MKPNVWVGREPFSSRRIMASWGFALMALLTVCHTVQGDSVYCIPGSLPGGGFNFWITRIEFNTITNDSGESVYSDFTHLTTPVNRLTSYPIRVTASDQHYNGDTCYVWVDWNRDETYDEGEKIELL